MDSSGHEDKTKGASYTIPIITKMFKEASPTQSPKKQPKKTRKRPKKKIKKSSAPKKAVDERSVENAERKWITTTEDVGSDTENDSSQDNSANKRGRGRPKKESDVKPKKTPEPTRRSERDLKKRQPPDEEKSLAPQHEHAPAQFACVRCKPNRFYREKRSLLTHVFAKHPLYCPECWVGFKHKEKARSHYIAAHIEKDIAKEKPQEPKKFCCKFCGGIFENEHDQNLHIIFSHWKEWKGKIDEKKNCNCEKCTAIVTSLGKSLSDSNQKKKTKVFLLEMETE